MRIPREFWLGLPFLLILITIGEIYDMRAPTLRLETDQNRILVHIEQFGGFNPGISRIQITDLSSNATIVELRSNAGTPRLYFLSLKEGTNSVSDINADADYAAYRLVIPRGNGSFSLEPGRPYLLSVWGRKRWGHHAEARLQFN